MSPAVAGLEIGAQARGVGHKLLLGDELPVADAVGSYQVSPVWNECRLGGRTDGILKVVGSDPAADRI